MCDRQCDRRHRARLLRTRTALRMDQGIDHGLDASFGPLTAAEIRQRDAVRLAQALRLAPPPAIAFGEVKSQAGMNEGLLQLRERLNRQARATPPNRPLPTANVGLAWYLPAAPGQPNLVRYMVANAGGDPRADRRVWQGNIGYIPPVPAGLVPAGSTPARARDLEAHWRENQVRLLLQRIGGQRFRPQALGHGGADLVRRFDDADDADAPGAPDAGLDAAIDAALDDLLDAMAA